MTKPAQHLASLDVRPASEWMRVLTTPQAAFTSIWGHDASLVAERVAFVRQVVSAFLNAFGDRDAFIVRCPGRINLRGMHVDTHGGYLNLMTHQREAVIVASLTGDDRFRFRNIDARFPEASFQASVLPAPGSQDWYSYITSATVRDRVKARGACWSNYLEGAINRLRYKPGRALQGVDAMVGCDVPQGAGLSSSTSVALAALYTVAQANAVALADDDLILAARDVEWYAGARIGVCDQAAMVLGRPNEIINTALYAEPRNSDSPKEPVLEMASERRCALPDSMQVLVVNSHTERHLSGSALVAYTRNRFAYSMAMDILRHELTARGVADTAPYARLSGFQPTSLSLAGGLSGLYELLARIPETASLADLERRYPLPRLKSLYEAAFGTIPLGDRPRSFDLRGPLVFGLAESERARLFYDAVCSGDGITAGRLMTLGHDGDRVNWPAGVVAPHYADAELAHHAAGATPVADLPGRYGASSPVLDSIVDAALAGGALGASLTGAGIAGSVLVLSETSAAAHVAHALRKHLASGEYARICGWADPLGETEAEASVVQNCAPAGVGCLSLQNAETQ